MNLFQHYLILVLGQVKLHEHAWFYCYMVIFCELHCALIAASQELWNFIAQNSQFCNYPHDDPHFFCLINVMSLSLSRFFFIKSTLPFVLSKSLLLWFPYGLFSFFPFFLLLLLSLFFLCLIHLGLTFMSAKQKESIIIFVSTYLYPSFPPSLWFPSSWNLIYFVAIVAKKMYSSHLFYVIF